MPSPPADSTPETAPTSGGYLLRELHRQTARSSISSATAPDGSSVIAKQPRWLDQAAGEAFRREARALASCRHPRLCRLLDIDADRDGRPLLLLRDAGASDLAQAVELPRPDLDPCRIAYDLAAALAALHAVGMAHRAVSAEHIVLEPAGATLVGLGSCSLPRESGPWPPSPLATDTLAWAPELSGPGDGSPAADCYALGQLLAALCQRYPGPPGLSPLSPLIARLCQPRPAARPSAAEVLAALAALPALPAPPSAGWPMLLAGAVAGAAVGGLLVVCLWPRLAVASELLSGQGEGEVRLRLPPGERVGVETLGDTRLRHAGSGPWQRGWLQLRVPADGVLQLQVGADDGRWELQIYAER